MDTATDAVLSTSVYNGKSYKKYIKLMDSDIIQRLQDTYSSMCSVSAIIVSPDGTPITKPSNPTRMCLSLITPSEKGSRLCIECAKYGALITQHSGHVSQYCCHCGLIEFTAPIYLDGKIVAIMIAGQVASAPMQLSSLHEIADEFSLDIQELIDAANEVPVRDSMMLQRAVKALDSTAATISNLIASKVSMNNAHNQIELLSNIKEDFLANMSHEIRTPMNAVIGMADMVLREKLPPSAREYVQQIHSSGHALINIVNDILDYTNISSGKLSIIPEEYEPIRVISDVSTVIMSRILDKEIELLLEIDPSIPKVLLGDSQRLRQILINLSNNAIKFTHSGYVLVTATNKPVDAENTVIQFEIIDTGVGIKQEDIPKLFGSFSQVDSKKNRGIEGTGLGLSIVSQLLKLMNGTIQVESEYGKGSTFRFELPQKIVQNTPSVTVSDTDHYLLVGSFANEDVAKDFETDSHELSLSTKLLPLCENPFPVIDKLLEENPDKEIYLIVSQHVFKKEDYRVFDFSGEKYKRLHIAILAETFADVRVWNDFPEISIIKKPFSVLSLATLLEESFTNSSNQAEPDSITFIAPEVKVLIVDDNPVNLTVASGLMEPLEMQIDTALSGKIALEMIDSTSYDIIFMDHMMPELDGIDTTRIIKRFHPAYKDVPIIALTANAMNGAREMFLQEGMSDFLAKPIDVRLLNDILRNWIAPEKIHQLTEAELEARRKAEESAESTAPSGENGQLTIGDLQVSDAIAMLGNEKLYLTILKQYYNTIIQKADTIQNAYTSNDWKTYTIEVHALKSASKQIGAMELSAMAAELEKAGNELNLEKIHADTSALLDRYRSYLPVFAPLFQEAEAPAGDKEAISNDVLSDFLNQLGEAVENLDLDTMEELMAKMLEYSYDEARTETINQLKEAVENIDVDTCEELINQWKSEL